MRDLSRPLFPIGVVAGLIGCSPSTLRSWEAKGLVSPYRDRHTGYRLYSWRDVERLQFIRYLVTKRKFPLREVKAKLRASTAHRERKGWIIDRRRPRKAAVALPLPAIGEDLKP